MMLDEFLHAPIIDDLETEHNLRWTVARARR